MLDGIVDNTAYLPGKDYRPTPVYALPRGLFRDEETEEDYKRMIRENKRSILEEFIPLIGIPMDIIRNIVDEDYRNPKKPLHGEANPSWKEQHGIREDGPKWWD